MCRMFLLVSDGDTERNILKAVLSSFKKAAHFDKYLKSALKQHPDGWGCVSFDLTNVGKNGFIYRSKKPAFEDNLLTTIVNSDIFEHNFLLLSHARKASPGTPLKLAQVHPFEKSINDMVIYLAHNGTISKEFLKSKFQVSSEGLSDTQMLLEIVEKNLPNYTNLKDLIVDLDVILMAESKKNPKVYTAAQFLVTTVEREQIQIFVQSLINTYRASDADTERLLDYYAIYLARLEYNNAKATIAASSTIFHYLEEEHSDIITYSRRLENGEYVEAKGSDLLNKDLNALIKRIKSS